MEANRVLSLVLPEGFESEVLKLSFYLANLYVLQGNTAKYAEEKRLYEEVLPFFKKISENGSKAYLKSVVLIYRNLVEISICLNKYDEVITHYLRAMQAYKLLKKEDMREHFSDVAKGYDNLAEINQCLNENLKVAK